MSALDFMGDNSGVINGRDHRDSEYPTLMGMGEGWSIEIELTPGAIASIGTGVTTVITLGIIWVGACGDDFAIWLVPVWQACL
jgi:hypothetical protein